MTRAVWLADVLRSAGLKVVEHNGWQGRGAAFPDLRAVVWHHDASPAGDSPGVPAYMLRQMAQGKAAAQVWVDRRGTWHVLAAGVAFHAGKVRAGMPGNYQSLGVETDHTIGEAWPAAQLNCLRKGTAAILARLGKDATGLHMHKSICDPPGRKTDPDGLDLHTERGRVAVLMANAAPKPTPAPQPPAPVNPQPLSEEDIVASIDEVRAVVRDEINRLSGGPRRRDADGNLIDGDPQTISVADVYSLVEALAARPCRCSCKAA